MQYQKGNIWKQQSIKHYKNTEGKFNLHILLAQVARPT